MCVGQLKGASAHTANEVLGSTHNFRWQTGYAALSVEEASLPAVIAYVCRQRQHHRVGPLPRYEHCDDDSPEGGREVPTSRPVHTGRRFEPGDSSPGHPLQG